VAGHQLTRWLSVIAVERAVGYNPD